MDAEQRKVFDEARANSERLADFRPRDPHREWLDAMPAASQQREFADWWARQPISDPTPVRAAMPEPEPTPEPKPEPVTESFSFQQHDVIGKGLSEIRKQLRKEIAEARVFAVAQAKLTRAVHEKQRSALLHEIEFLRTKCVALKSRLDALTTQKATIIEMPNILRSPRHG